MKLSVALLFISLSLSSAFIGGITGPITDFFEDDIGGGLSDLGGWLSNTFDPVGGWFEGPVANFFTPIGDGIYFVLKETGDFFISGYTAIRLYGGAIFGGGAVEIPPVWSCHESTSDNGVTFRTNVPIKSVKTMFDKDGDASTPDEEITDIACLIDESGDCAYGWCENPTNLADDAPSAMCTQKPLWAEARDPCVVLYMGKGNEPPTEPCALEAKHPVSGEMVKTFEGTPCFDGNYVNGDDECFNGACVPSDLICRDDDDWSSTFGPFTIVCNGYPTDFCDQYPNADGVTAATACPVTCNTCIAQGKPHIDTSKRSLNEPDAEVLAWLEKREQENASGRYTYHVAGGVLLGAVIVFGFITKFRRGKKARVTVMETPEPTVF